MIVSLRKVLTHCSTNFGSHQNSVAVPGRLQPPANDLLGNASRIVRSPYRVTICRVDQIPARIHIRTEDSVRRCLIGAPAELHGSKSDRGDKKPRISELAIANFYIHSYTLILRVWTKSSPRGENVKSSGVSGASGFRRAILRSIYCRFEVRTARNVTSLSHSEACILADAEVWCVSPIRFSSTHENDPIYFGGNLRRGIRGGRCTA